MFHRSHQQTAKQESISLHIPSGMVYRANVTSFDFICGYIKGHGNITILSFCYNNISDDQVAQLIMLGTLLELDIANNDITHTGAEIIANSSILHLNISNNLIGDQGAKALANSKLITLFASNCKISNVGSEALSHNNTLEDIDLPENKDINKFHFVDNIRLFSVNLRGTNVNASHETALPFYNHEKSIQSLQYLSLHAAKLIDNPVDRLRIPGAELTSKDVFIKSP